MVLADGRIWDGLRTLRKDNTGYDLKQLFIGAEGTLGVITAAVLRLVPRPRERQTAWLGVPSPQAAVALLALFRERLGETVSSFELMAGACVELVLRYLPGARRPLARAGALVRAGRGRLVARRGPRARRSSGCWPSAIEQGLVLDGAIAASEAQRKALWALRENPTEAMAHEGVVLRHDVAVPVSKVPELIERGAAAARAGAAGRAHRAVRPCRRRQHPLQSAAAADDERRRTFRARGDEVQALVFDLVERARRQHQRRARHRPAQARRARAPQVRRSSSS